MTQIASLPGEVLHMDYMKIGNKAYVLTMMDSLTGKIILVPTSSPNSNGVVRALMTWHSHYGLIPHFTLVSDQGSHFVNKVVKA